MSHASVPMTDSEPLLAVEDLHVAYGKTAALHGVNLRIDRGETVALIGANGAGKSTTLRTISGLLAPARGRIRFKGASIAGCRPDQIVRQGIAHSPEERRLILQLLSLGDALAAAEHKRAPNMLCEYAFELAQNFSRFYSEHHVLSESDAALRTARLGLCALVLAVLTRVLDLLGIEVPERM